MESDDLIEIYVKVKRLLKDLTSTRKCYLKLNVRVLS